MRQFLDILSKVEGVIGSLIINDKGKIIFSKLGENVKERMIELPLSELIKTMSVFVESFFQSLLENGFIEFGGRKMFFQKIKNGILIVFTRADANIGLIRTEMKDTVERINKL